MALPKGVFQAKKKDGSLYYRVSITYHGRHISLGSFDDTERARLCFLEAEQLLHTSLDIDGHTAQNQLSFEKWVILVNFRDNGIYFKTPIYLYKKYFLYYLSKERPLKFDADDLFFYSRHTIMARNGHLFVSDYGMQINLLSRYGIRSHAVAGRDYCFANGDCNDFTYENIIIINRYFGVERILRQKKIQYRVKIHIIGDYVVGYYDNEETAAIAYNKAAELLKEKGFTKKYPENYIENMSAIDYAKIYNGIKLSKSLRNL